MSLSKVFRVVALALAAALVPATALAGTPVAAGNARAVQVQQPARLVKGKTVKAGKAKMTKIKAGAVKPKLVRVRRASR